ncbi:MAG: hypothetical protein KGZ58_03265 [Ignavibacteriales bacterium]|nr:hypothetical protein [Ignavibacteriales bacterium]
MNNTYTNRDFYLSAYLIASGLEMKSHTSSNGVTTFIFEDSDTVQEFVSNYYG